MGEGKEKKRGVNLRSHALIIKTLEGYHLKRRLEGSPGLKRNATERKGSTE